MTNVLCITRYNPLKISKDDVSSKQWWSQLHFWADVFRADFETVTVRYLQNISPYLSCTTERMLRTIIMQNFRLIQACFPSKIVEVWFHRFCVRYDWWRRLELDGFGCSRGLSDTYPVRILKIAQRCFLPNPRANPCRAEMTSGWMASLSDFILA